MRRFRMFSSANVIIFVVLIALQSPSVAAQMRGRNGPGLGRPGQPYDPRTEEFIVTAGLKQSQFSRFEGEPPWGGGGVVPVDPEFGLDLRKQGTVGKIT